jgi:hypothetical protein
LNATVFWIKKLKEIISTQGNDFEHRFSTKQASRKITIMAEKVAMCIAAILKDRRFKYRFRPEREWAIHFL